MPSNRLRDKYLAMGRYSDGIDKRDLKGHETKHQQALLLVTGREGCL